MVENAPTPLTLTAQALGVFGPNSPASPPVYHSLITLPLLPLTHASSNNRL
jgi:hypothetical protein